MSEIGVPPGPTPGAPPTREGGARRWPWIVGAALVLVASVVMVLVPLLATDDRFASFGLEHPERYESSAGGGSPGGPEIPERPPSERRELPSTSVPAVVERPNLDTGAARSGERFDELECQFAGTSLLDPPLDGSDLGAAAPRTMRLEPGAAFDCLDGAQRSAGTLELDAAFESLDAFSGVGDGTGRITWSEVAPAERAPGELLRASATLVEVQLDLPVIAVWTTIVDGPYAGFRGRLVLRDWELLRDRRGNVTGVSFARTSTTFAPG